MGNSCAKQTLWFLAPGYKKLATEQYEQKVLEMRIRMGDKRNELQSEIDDKKNSLTEIEGNIEAELEGDASKDKLDELAKKAVKTHEEVKILEARMSDLDTTMFTVKNTAEFVEDSDFLTQGMALVNEGQNLTTFSSRGMREKSRQLQKDLDKINSSRDVASGITDTMNEAKSDLVDAQKQRQTEQDNESAVYRKALLKKIQNRLDKRKEKKEDEILREIVSDAPDVPIVLVRARPPPPPPVAAPQNAAGAAAAAAPGPVVSSAASVAAPS